jgi:hypothetical protein
MKPHRALGTTTAAVLALTGSLLAACGQPTDSGEPSDTTSSVPLHASPSLDVADLAQLAPKGPEDNLPVLLATSRAAADDLLIRTGIVELLPSAQEGLDVLGAALAEQSAVPASAGTTEPAGIRRSPVAHGIVRQPSTSPAPYSSQGAALGLATLGNLINAALENNADGTPLNGDQTVNFGDPVEGTPEVQAKLVDGTMELRVLQRASDPVDGGEMSVDIDLRGELDACPSADGTVTAALSADVRIEAVAGASTASGRYTMQLDITASVNDAAELTQTVIDVFGSSSDTTATMSDESGAAIDGWFVEGGSRTTLAGRPPTARR